MSNQYFENKLNYTLANEDTALEVALLPLNASHVFTVAGSGGRAMPLLSRAPKKLTCVDVSPFQLYLTEMRIEGVKALSLDEFKKLFGYPGVEATAEERKKIFNSLTLSNPAREYLSGMFESIYWKPLLYLGKWENLFVNLSKVNSKITGRAGRKIFECRDLKEQKEYFKKRFPRLRWKLVLALLGNASVFNALLYKGDFTKKNISESYVGFYNRVFAHLFENTLARENFFLQLLFMGEIAYPEGCTVECHPDVFAAAKEGAKNCEVSYQQGDVIELAQTANSPIDFYSLSDVPSYFTGNKEKKYLADLLPHLSKNALVVLRHYLHIPENSDKTGYVDITQNYRELISKEKVGVYEVELLKKI